MDESPERRETAYYYPEPYWLADEGGWVESLLLFFDEIPMRPEHLLNQRDRHGDDWRYIVILGVSTDEELHEFDARYELTRHPAELLWGPGDRAQCADWLLSATPAGDEVTCLDRLFVVRTDGGRVFPPRRPDVMLSLDGDWCLIRADSPFDAHYHSRHSADGESCSDEDRCPVEDLGSGSWAEVAAMINRELPGVQPRFRRRFMYRGSTRSRRGRADAARA